MTTKHPWSPKTADQIANEAKVILEYHKRLGVACFYGGVNIKGDKAHLDKKYKKKWPRLEFLPKLSSR